MTSSPTLLLLDNGSRRAEATLHLRRLAAQLSAALGRAVQPVSLAHADQVDPLLLDGSPARTLAAACREGWQRGQSRYLVLPLFIGPSRALSREIPLQVERLHADGVAIALRVLAPLAQPDGSGDGLLAQLLEEQLDPLLLASVPPTVILVDHGSPSPAVSAVRERLAGALRARLAGRARQVLSAAMERRPGPDYAFAGPLLAELLAELSCDPQAHEAPVLLSLLFLSPGRHAGPAGDVASIAHASPLARRIALSKPLGEHPALPALLAQRLRTGLAHWYEAPSD